MTWTSPRGAGESEWGEGSLDLCLDCLLDEQKKIDGWNF